MPRTPPLPVQDKVLSKVTEPWGGPREYESIKRSEAIRISPPDNVTAPVTLWPKDGPSRSARAARHSRS